MLNPSQKRVLLIASLIFAMFVIAETLEFVSSSNYEIAESANEQYQQHEATNDINGLFALLLALNRFFTVFEKLFLVASTIAIAFFTYTLWRATSGLFAMAKQQSDDMRNSLDIAKQSAESTALQTRAFVASQIPVVAWSDLYLVDHEIKDPEQQRILNGAPHALCRPVFKLQNIGPTTISILYYALKYEVDVTLQREPIFGGMMPSGAILKPGHDFAFTIGEPISFNDAGRQHIECGFVTLWVYGFVFYNDFLSEGHQIGVCARWDTEKGFVQEIRENYSYQRHQKQYT